MSDTYKCCMCDKVFEKGWSDEEALKESKNNFGDVLEDELEVVCDDCYQICRLENNPGLLEELIVKFEETI